MDFLLTKEDLEKSYQEQFDKVFHSSSLSPEDLKESRSLFEPDSLKIGTPLPKKLDTYCIVGGVPFKTKDIENISILKSKISKILSGIQTYFVEPHNLGVELAILKWPDSPLAKDILSQVILYMEQNPPPRFILDIEGYQFHKDGCLVLRGFDRNSLFREYRGRLLNELKSMPQKQSSWCHIPLGRILTPLDQSAYELLFTHACHSQVNHRFSIVVDCLQLLHETRWYQIDRQLLRKFLSYD